MIYFLLFLVLLCLIGGLGYLAHQIIKEQAEEQKARAREQQLQAEQFRRALCHALQDSGNAFQFASFVTTTGVPMAVATEVAEETYGRIYARAASDGVFTPRENAQLGRLANALAIPADRRSEIESRMRQEKYREQLQRSLGDGVFTESELAELDRLRTTLGLTRAELSAASAGTSTQAYLAHFRAIVRRGIITQEDVSYLAKLRSATGLTDEHGYEIVRRDAMAIYYERFCEIKQDGKIAPEEEAELSCLQNFLGIPDNEVQSARQEIERIRMLSRIRGGELPRIVTRKMLAGGEICHWESPCRHVHETRTRTQNVDGELLVTSHKIIFCSPAKSFEFKPSRIINIQPFSDAVLLQTSGSKGNGYYFLQDTALAAAVLEGIVRKQKYLAAESFASTMSRRIPDDVKQEVWARDGGHCVKCRANDYLEYDHIIPHGKGGASSVNNVQLLCRRCNLAKSDRIG